VKKLVDRPRARIRADGGKIGADEERIPLTRGFDQDQVGGLGSLLAVGVQGSASAYAKCLSRRETTML
jgi:hypothetical protein